MEGAWSLMRLSHAQGGVEDASVSGFMLMIDGYMSIVIHALDPGEGGAAPQFLFQASVNAFELRGVGEMFCASQIGHSNFGPAFEPELENLPRIFGIEFNGEDLTLVREDDSRLQFRRLKEGYFPPGADSYLNELGELNRR